MHEVSRTSLQSLQSLGLVQFPAEKLYGHQHGNNGGGSHGESPNLLAREAEVVMGDVCKRERGGDRRVAAIR
jgi:hypothetical protein